MTLRDDDDDNYDDTSGQKFVMMEFGCVCLYISHGGWHWCHLVEYTSGLAGPH